MEPREFTLAVYSENYSGLLNRITVIINRRKINIESLTVSESEIPGIHRYTMVVVTTEDQVRKLTQQIDKQVEVMKARYFENETILFREIALYKVENEPAYADKLQSALKKYAATIISTTPEYVVIENTGTREETQALLDDLKPIGIQEFVRSGRVSITKPQDHIEHYLEELERQSEILNQQ